MHRRFPGHPLPMTEISKKSLFVLRAHTLFVFVSPLFVAGLCRRGKRHDYSLDVCTWGHYLVTECVQEPA